VATKANLIPFRSENEAREKGKTAALHSAKRGGQKTRRKNLYPCVCEEHARGASPAFPKHSQNARSA